MSGTNRKGATGALLDVYEQALSDLKQLVKTIPNEKISDIVDPHTADENCRSIQTILTHVVYAAFGYANSIHNSRAPFEQRPEKIFHLNTQEYLHELDQVLVYTEKVLADIADHALEQYDSSQKIKVSWGQLYDIEQLMEHAIVHVLRHHRQLNLILKNNYSPLY